MINIEKRLQEIVGKDNLLKNEPMSKHTSIRIGGIAEYYIRIKSVDILKNVLAFSNENTIPVTIIGNGTNLLVREGGIKGLVLKLDFKNFKIKSNKEDIFITVEAGMSLASLSLIALKEELEGLEFLSGIPGTIGGAVRMNAGAYGSEIKDFIVKTRYMTYSGEIKTLSLDEHEFEYRNSIFSKKNWIIVDTTLRVKKGNKDNIKSKIDELAISRRNNQPLDYPSAGSTFKRKEGFVTAKIIDECGLKGYSVGDAEVSTKHAGFIINKGNASSKDVLEVVNYVKKIIKEKYNVDLELEILVLGEEE